MTIYSEIRDNLNSSETALGETTGIDLVAVALSDLQKEYGIARVSYPFNQDVAREMNDLRNFYSMRAEHEYEKQNWLNAFAFYRARYYMRVSQIKMRASGEWYKFPLGDSASKN